MVATISCDGAICPPRWTERGDCLRGFSGRGVFGQQIHDFPLRGPTPRHGSHVVLHWSTDFKISACRWLGGGNRPFRQGTSTALANQLGLNHHRVKQPCSPAVYFGARAQVQRPSSRYTKRMYSIRSRGQKQEKNP